MLIYFGLCGVAVIALLWVFGLSFVYLTWVVESGWVWWVDVGFCLIGWFCLIGSYVACVFCWMLLVLVDFGLMVALWFAMWFICLFIAF